MAYDRKEYQKEYYKKNKDRISERKRKTTDYHKEYVKKMEKNRRFTIDIEKTLANKLENKLTKEGVTITDFFRKAIEEYIK